MTDKGEKCAVFGVYGKGLDVGRLAFYSLFTLQHRGQEGSGIASSDGTIIRYKKGSGLVSSIFREQNIHNLQGLLAVGHNRYSTSKGTSEDHLQPIVSARTSFAHNGNLPSTKKLEEFLTKNNINYEDSNDSRMMALAFDFLYSKNNDIKQTVTECFDLFTGSFSIVASTLDSLIAFRDPCGIRPLSLAKLDNGYVVASETCAFHTIGAEFLRDIKPGELVIINESGVTSFQIKESNPKLDIFEFVYFARPDSIINGVCVHDVRRNYGKLLANRNKIDADVVIPVPETALPVASGYAEESGIPLEFGLCKNRYIGRTFISPGQGLRKVGVNLKLSPILSVIKDKRVLLIDDSIVRGTTSKKIIAMLFEAGAKEVHFLVSSAPVRFPDFYGIDISKQEELLAFGKSEQEVCDYLGATSVQYLSIDDMVLGTGMKKEEFSLACFDGVYPIDILERKSEINFSNN